MLGHEPVCTARTMCTKGTRTADGSSCEPGLILTTEQPAQAHAAVSAFIRRAAFALPAAWHDRTPLVTTQPLARRREARGRYQGRHGGIADKVRVTP